MRRLPKFILVVASIHSKKHKNSSKILIEYLEGLPHIQYKGCGSFSNVTCYIIQNTAGLQHMINEVAFGIGVPSMIGHATYERILGKNGIVYRRYPFSGSYNSLAMPSHIGIATEDIEKLTTLSKD